jgi:dihydrofolate reductase
VSRVVVFEHLTLDGVMQAPGRPDEDRRDGFEHGGWATLWDPVVGAAEERMTATEALLFGRRTYEAFYSYWPKQTDNRLTDVLTGTRKYVASRTLREPLPWENSTLLEGEAGEAVSALKEHPGADLVVLGSGDLIRTLMRSALVDEFVLLIQPLVLGSGRRLFADDCAPAALQLVDAKTSPTGVLIATYRRAERPGANCPGHNGERRLMSNSSDIRSVEAPSPPADLKALGDRLVGSWNVSGETEGETSWEWMDGGFFLIQRGWTRREGVEQKYLQIIGCDRMPGSEPAAAITGRLYTSHGDTLAYTCELDRDTMTIWMGEKGSPAVYHGTFSADGNTIDGAWEWPGGGYTETMTRVTAPGGMPD